MHDDLSAIRKDRDSTQGTWELPQTVYSITSLKVVDEILHSLSKKETQNQIQS